MDEKAEAATQEAAVSTQKTLLSCHDPGWNDPPKWAFTGGESTPTKRSLNKRVAFPLSSPKNGSLTAMLTSKSDGLLESGSSPLAAPSYNAPISLPATIPLLPPCTNDTSDIDQQKALIETMENFEAILSKELESSSKKGQVVKRLDAMQVMWKEDKLKAAIHQKVLAISKALRENDVDGADKELLSLMMDDGALCNTWISGIRHIILELRQRSSQPKSTALSQEDSYPYFLPPNGNE